MRAGCATHGGEAQVSVAPTRASPVRTAGSPELTGASGRLAAVRNGR
jgi:hypothetical protein